VAKNPRTPWLSKLLIGPAIAYLLSPVDVIPILSHLDDVILVPGLIWLALAIIPQSVKQDALEAASKDAKPLIRLIKRNGLEVYG